MITLTVPTPPSVNEMYGNNRGSGRGRFKTKRYQTWLRAAKNEVVAQKPGHIAGPVSVKILVHRRNPRSDVDNRIKASLDLLQVCGVIDDDKCVHSVTATWAPVSGAVIEIESLAA